jgi:hypothetical protein
MGQQGIVASICAENTTDASAPDYGYRPAIEAIIERLKSALQGTCWPRKVQAQVDGTAPCIVLEATQGQPQSDGTWQCPACDPSGGRTTPPAVSMEALKKDSSFQDSGLHCACEIPQVSAAQMQACAGSDTEPAGVDGWCYVDPETNPSASNKLVDGCPKTSRRMIRFVGAGNPVAGSLTYVQCRGAVY